MAQLSVQINGFSYALACGDGEEPHLRALAADLDQRIEAIKAMSGPGPEARLLVMAALMISDELHDLRAQKGVVAKPEGEPKAARRLRGLAKRAETIADAAEAPALTLTPAPEPEVVAVPPAEA